jgi:hypothetical protein
VQRTNQLHLVLACSCRPSPCRRCRTCSWKTAAWIRNSTWDLAVPDQIALTFGTFCRGSGRPSNLCSSIQAEIQSSASGNLGKRAGALCRVLGDCNPSQFGLTCSLAYTGDGALSATDPVGVLDLCTSEGTSTGSAVPGVKADFALASGRCLTSADCGSTSLMCSMAVTTQQCTCAAGKDTCVAVGYCVRTPCKICNDCLTDMRAFAQQVSCC